MVHGAESTKIFLAWISHCATLRGVDTLRYATLRGVFFSLALNQNNNVSAFLKAVKVTG
jgi:hypothetical protein